MQGRISLQNIILIAALLVAPVLAAGEDCTTSLLIGAGIGVGVTSAGFIAGICIYRCVQKRKERAYAQVQLEQESNTHDLQDLKSSPAPVAVVPSRSEFRSVQVESPAPKKDELQLDAFADLDIAEFQAKWAATTVSDTIEVGMYSIPEEDAVADMLAPLNIRCVASGTVGSQMKFYFFAKQQKTDKLLLAELVINTNTRILSAKFKCEDTKLTPLFSSLFRETLRTITK